MTNAPYLIRSLSLEGFRAYLRPKRFEFSEKPCLAIFAPNGNGKSSVIDALEFMFSKDGTLERLGLRTVNNQAGAAAMAHCGAEEAGIAPSVSIEVTRGREVADGSRDAAGARRPMPPIAEQVGACFTVSPIVRGHGLRAFVEDHSPEQRYADVATWLRLGPLVEVQKNLRALRAQIKAASEDGTALHRIDTQAARETGSAVAAWDDAKVLAHINSAVVAPLDGTLIFAALANDDPAYAILVERVKAEEQRVGLAGLRQLKEAVLTIYSRNQDSETGEVTTSGALPAFEDMAAAMLLATHSEAEERGKAANAAFQAVWQAAEPLFAEDVTVPDECPVCATPLVETRVGGADGIRLHLVAHLEELADYAAARQALDTAARAVDKAQTQLAMALQSLSGLLGDESEALKALLARHRTAALAWTGAAPPDSTPLVEALISLRVSLEASIAEIEERQGEHTYAKAKARVDRLLDLKAERLLAERTQSELLHLSSELTTQATAISGEIRAKVQSLLDQLQTPMNDIYKLIHGATAVPIRLELPAEDDANQQRLNLVVDFAENRSGVQPSGYLSDSQIHSVALALRMAAIRQFNASAPLMALDDIVTSYDADHRRAVAGLIATNFEGSQIVLTTHDERFFNYLKDQLPQRDWHFTRIIGLDPAYGPRFADHKVTDAMIEARWEAGESAANEMRQAEEEWLLGICRDFGVSVRIRPLEKAYSYERSELASALAAFLKDARLEPLAVPGVANRFATSLQRGEIENFGSHFHDGPYGDGSIGDERTRWNEFKAFRAQFSCPRCRRIKFQRPFPLKKPVCAHDGCEAQFGFEAAEPATGEVSSPNRTGTG